MQQTNLDSKIWPEDQCKGKWTRWQRCSTLHVPTAMVRAILYKDGRRHYTTTQSQASSVLRVDSRVHQEPTAFPYKERGGFIPR